MNQYSPKIIIRQPKINPDGTIEIFLTRGFSTLIDTCDSDLADFNWSARPDWDNCYVNRLSGKNKHQELHRIILSRMLDRDLLRSEHVDHIDGNGLNNRRSNLRLATPAQNQHNARRRADNTSGFKGVKKLKNKERWVSAIQNNGKRYYLGCFPAPELAYEAYCAKAKELFGEFWNPG